MRGGQDGQVKSCATTWPLGVEFTGADTGLIFSCLLLCSVEIEELVSRGLTEVGAPGEAEIS